MPIWMQQVLKLLVLVCRQQKKTNCEALNGRTCREQEPGLSCSSVADVLRGVLELGLFLSLVFFVCFYFFTFPMTVNLLIFN